MNCLQGPAIISMKSILTKIIPAEELGMYINYNYNNYMPCRYNYNNTLYTYTTHYALCTMPVPRYIPTDDNQHRRN